MDIKLGHHMDLVACLVVLVIEEEQDRVDQEGIVMEHRQRQELASRNSVLLTVFTQMVVQYVLVPVVISHSHLMEFSIITVF